MRQLTLRDLCLVALVVSTILIANGVRTEIALGTFHPFSADYRFAGTLHPNVQAPYCATMALAAACLASRAKRGGALLWMLFLVGVALLVLTKSRTVCGAFLAGWLVYSWIGALWPSRIMAGTAILALGCTLALAASLLGWDIERQGAKVALIGRQEEAESLSGRFPLWADLTPHIQDRFLLGHGYLTFWNPERIATFSRSLQWAVPDGHCAYLDAILDLGAIGLAICVAAVLAGIRAVGRRVRAGADYGCGFLFLLLIFRTMNGILESSFAVPTSLVPFMMVCGLVHLGFCEQPDPSPATEEPSSGPL